MAWNLIDLGLVAVLLINVWNGWRRGLLLGLLDLLGGLGSLLLAWRFYPAIARWMSARFDLSEVWARPAAFVLVAAGAGALITLIGYAVLNRVPGRVQAHGSNRLLGILPGLVNGLLIASITAALLLILPLPTSVQAAAHQSVLASPLASFTERGMAALTPIFGDVVAQTLDLLTVHPQSDERIDLPFTVQNPQPRPDLENEMLQLVNKERSAARLPPLKADPALTLVGRQHSADMFERGYFSHITPEGLTPFDRMRNANITYLAAGENLALAPTLEIAHNGLMNSPGHRANILSPDFGRVGIGIMDGGVRGLMISQEFRN